MQTILLTIENNTLHMQNRFGASAALASSPYENARYGSMCCLAGGELSRADGREDAAWYPEGEQCWVVNYSHGPAFVALNLQEVAEFLGAESDQQVEEIGNGMN